MDPEAVQRKNKKRSIAEINADEIIDLTHSPEIKKRARTVAYIDLIGETKEVSKEEFNDQEAKEEGTKEETKEETKKETKEEGTKEESKKEEAKKEDDIEHFALELSGNLTSDNKSLIPLEEKIEKLRDNIANIHSRNPWLYVEKP